MKNIAPRDTSEIEAIEQREWLESLDYIINREIGAASSDCLRPSGIVPARRAWRCRSPP